MAPGSCTRDGQIQSWSESIFPDGSLIWIVDDWHGIFHVVSLIFTGKSYGLGISVACIWIYGYFCFLFVHLYLGTIGNPGSVSAMIGGYMEKPVLRMLHPKWYKEMEHEGKLITK